METKRYNKFFTKGILNDLKKYPLYSQDGKGKNAKCICKFFCCCFTWYILEGSEENGDLILFGITVNESTGECEYGYISANELTDIKINIPVKIKSGQKVYIPVTVERDRYFEPEPLKDIDSDILQNFLN